MSIDLSMIQYYAARAREYDRVYDKPERQDELGVIKKLLESTFLNEHVCEVACGTGYWTQFLARSAKSVWATDATEATLNIARARNLGTQVQFDCQNAFNLPCPNQPYSAGLAAFLWSHLSKPDITRFLDSFHHTLKPGAKVICMDNVYVEGSSTPISRTDQQGNTYQMRHLENGSNHEVMKNFPPEAELLNAVKGVSTEASVQFLKYYWILSYRVKR